MVRLRRIRKILTNMLLSIALAAHGQWRKVSPAWTEDDERGRS